VRKVKTAQEKNKDNKEKKRKEKKDDKKRKERNKNSSNEKEQKKKKEKEKKTKKKKPLERGDAVEANYKDKGKWCVHLVDSSFSVSFPLPARAGARLPLAASSLLR
jgi:hypothetical protein